MFKEMAGNPRIGSSSLRWLATAGEPSASWERRFLATALGHLEDSQQRNVRRACAAGDETEVEALVYELIAHELLQRLGLEPSWRPRVGKQTPDLGFRAEAQEFIADCVVVHSPDKTVSERPDGTGRVCDRSMPGWSRAHKVYERLEEKAGKYAAIPLPLLVFVFAGDLHLMDPEVVERALYGRTTGEADVGETFPSVGRAPVLSGGLLLPTDEGVRHANLAAAVWCDWFSADRGAPRERRLHCVVCHHWTPRDPLPTAAFEPFCQIGWEPAANGEWTPRLIGEPNIVAGFEGNETLTCRPYSVEEPW